jgi:long-chain acyl-CoA synthetase
LVRLRAEGCRIFLWSAGGADYARRRATDHGVDGYFDGFYEKDERDSDGRYVPAFLRDPLDATFVDDRPEDMPIGSTVMSVSPYLVDDPFDEGFRRALA